MKIIISGLYSGTNPQPGVGIARSLREAYPEATLIGLEYSNRCSGIHWPGFDEIWLQRPWHELNLDRHAEAIRKRLDAGELLISCNDLEIMWLAEVFPDGHPNLLTPPAEALRQTGKPAVPAVAGLPIGVPTFVSTELSDWDLHTFCRQHDWKVWLKGPYYEAVRVRNWAELEAMRATLKSAWSIEKLFLQAHVTGYEECISFSAYRGELLHCVMMRKRDLTEIAKTWAGDVSEVPESLKAPLRKVIKDINWTGGGELETLLDADGGRWMLEWNPRYPAWIHGATIAGHNMAAILIEGATGIQAKRRTSPTTNEFTRVVLEIPVKPEMPLSPLPEPFAGGIGHSMKHPSGLLAFAEKLQKLRHRDEADSKTEAPQEQLPVIPETFTHDIAALDADSLQTPQFLFLHRTADEVLARAAAAARNASTESVEVSNAYSIKTNPDPRMLKAALRAGFLAEAISPPEVAAALKAGFRPEQVILNGPGKWWCREALPSESLHAVFCDSVEDLRRVVAAIESGELKTNIAGIRLRTPNVASRFGFPLHKPELFETLIEAVKTLPESCVFGVHFHMASSTIGIGQWKSLFQSMLGWCTALQNLSGRTIECLDIGGGWAPDDWQDGAEEGRFVAAVKAVQEQLPGVRQLVSEPGKAVAQPSMALAMRILEIGDSGEDEKESVEAVVDGSIAELPMYFVHPHRILHQAADGDGNWQTVGRGNTHLMGRLCMEHDIVATGVALPEGAKAGDLLIFCDAGAYDKSMSYVFGHGE